MMEIDDEIKLTKASVFASLRRRDVVALMAVDHHHYEDTTYDLNAYSENIELIRILPTLCRTTLCPPIVDDILSTEDRMKLRAFLLSHSRTNTLVTFMSVDFSTLESDLRKEWKLRKKALSAGDGGLEFYLNQPSPAGVGHRFEIGSASEKFRILLSELNTMQLLLNDYVQKRAQNSKTKLAPLRLLRKFEPLQNAVYVGDCCDLICVFLAERPTLFSVEDLCETLLFYKNGPYIIQNVVLNFSDMWEKVWRHLIDNADTVTDEETPVSRKRMEALHALCGLNPANSMDVVSYCIDKRKMHIALDIATHHTPFDILLPLLSGILMGTDDQQRSSFTSFIHAGQRAKPNSSLSRLITNLKAAIMENMKTIISLQSDARMDDYMINKASTLIRFFCGLRCLANLKFTDEETALLIEVICCKIDASDVGARFICTGLAALLACPYGGAGQPAAEIDATITAWLKHLMVVNTNAIVSNMKNYMEMVLLIIIHFNSNQIALLSQLISTVLRMKIVLRNNQLARLRAIFTQDFFQDQVIGERMAHIPVTPNLNADVAGYLPIHCVQHLMQTRLFARHRIFIKDWIVRQLEQCTAPVHAAVPCLIEVYASNCLHFRPMQQGSQNAIPCDPIDESTVIECFSGDIFDETRVTYRILMMYYVLLYEELLCGSLRNTPPGEKSSVGYSQEVFDRMPVKYLMAYAESHPNQYASIYAALLKVVVSQFPYLFSTGQESNEVTTTNNIRIDFSDSELSISVIDFGKALKESSNHPATAILALRRILRLPIRAQFRYMDELVDAIPALLQPGVPFRIIQLAGRLWYQLESFLPRQLYLRTVASLMPKPRPNVVKSTSQKRPTHADLCNDPLTVLRCDERVFRCAPILTVMLRVLHCYLGASRAYLQRQLATTSTAAAVVARAGTVSNVANTQNADIEREELMRSLIGIQESLAVQILLEACLPTAEEKQQNSLSTLQEIRCVICSYVHQIFISDVMLSKLVHFQTYPPELLPITVSGIPSMHICLDFLPELFAQPVRAKRVFAIDLLSFLCEQYPIPKAYNVACLAISVLSTLTGAISGDETVIVFSELLPALSRLNRIFPPLSSEICSLLVQVGRLCVARLAVDDENGPFWRHSWTLTTCYSSADPPEKRLLNGLLEFFRVTAPESVLSCPF